MSKVEEYSIAALHRDPAQAAIEFEDHWYNWGALRRVADQMNAAIDASGATIDAPISLIPRNRPSAVAALIGLLSRSRTIRMIYAFQSPVAIARNIERLKPAVLVASIEDFSEEVRAELKRLGIAAIALGDMDAGPLAGFERSTIDAESIPTPQIELLTSGTTGPPKQFAVTHDILDGHLTGGVQIAAMAADDGQEAPPLFLCKPIGNIAGLYSTIPTLLRGQCAVLVDRFTLENWRDYVKRYRPERTGMPATGVQMILDAKVPREELSSLRSLSTGASPLDPSVQRRFEDEYGIPILLSYGATEFAGPVATMTPALAEQWGRQKLGSVGRAMPGMQLRVVDPATSEILPPGQEGLLEVLAPRVGNHWIRTSDVAVIDADEFLFIRGRADGAIMRGGFKILPETVERALMLHESISSAGVVGVPDRRLGQVPAAAIQLRPGTAAPTIVELEMHLRNHLLATHLPVHWRFVTALPMTATAKVDRPALRKLFEGEAQPLPAASHV